MSGSAPAAWDFVIIGSGFGGSICAMRLAEHGHRVLVLEQGRRFRDEDFPETNWRVRRYLWAPLLRCFGILEISAFRDVWVLHGAGVGGGSLGYAGVLMEPPDALFDSPGWRRLADWKTVLRPHFDTAKRMLGVAPTRRLFAADEAMRDAAKELGSGDTFAPTPVGVFFGEDGQEGRDVRDPYFGGSGPARRACDYCGGCMVGCRKNAKNTLPKNYLWFAERMGVEVRAEREVRDIRLLGGHLGGARYEVVHRRSTAILRRGTQSVLAKNVIVAAGTLGTLQLLLRARDVTRSLPALSPRLGDSVRTNSERLLGSISRDDDVDYSRGVAIGSVLQADDVTTIEPVRYPAGSSVMKFLSGPFIAGGSVTHRALTAAWYVATHPMDFVHAIVRRGWAERGTIVLVMQTTDARLRMRLGRSLLTRWRRGLVSSPENGVDSRASFDVGRQYAEAIARRTNGVVMASVNDSLFGTPLTAHILGGCPMGLDRDEGVVDAECHVHGYPGLYVVDGSIVPGNPGVNPSLTIAALAEYAASRISGKEQAEPQGAPRTQRTATV